jgi:hypothetical protein
MVEGRERIPAAVILIIFLIGAIVVYLITIPQPVAYKLIFGNFSTNTTTNKTHLSGPVGSFYFPITSYLGGNPSVINSSYTLGTFGATYNEYNSTIGNANQFTLTSSIFGSSSYNVGFNGTPGDDYFLSMYVSSVSGSPKLSVSINGNSFYSTLPASTEKIVIKIPSVNKGNNVISIFNNLNGFAFTQGITFSNVSVTQMYSNNASHYSSVTAITLSGFGNYYLEFTPIGYGNITVSVDGYPLEKFSSASDNPITLMIPASVVNQAIKTTASAVLPVTFNVGFTVNQQSTYEIANAALVYSLPQIKQNSMTIPYSVKRTNSSQYVLTFYVNNILESGNVNFNFYPSGASFQIPSTNLVTGENILLISASSLSGDVVSGNFTGTVQLSTNGLIIPDYIALKSAS